MAGNFNTFTRLRPVLIGVGIGLVLGILADVFANPDPSKVQSPVVYHNPVSGRTGRFDRRGMPGIVFLPILGAFCGIAFLLAQSTRIAPRTPKPTPAAKDGKETRPEKPLGVWCSAVAQDSRFSTGEEVFDF